MKHVFQADSTWSTSFASTPDKRRLFVRSARFLRSSTGSNNSSCQVCVHSGTWSVRRRLPHHRGRSGHEIHAAIGCDTSRRAPSAYRPEKVLPAARRLPAYISPTCRRDVQETERRAGVAASPLLLWSSPSSCALVTKTKADAKADAKVGAKVGAKAKAKRKAKSPMAAPTGDASYATTFAQYWGLDADVSSLNSTRTCAPRAGVCCGASTHTAGIRCCAGSRRWGFEASTT